MKAVPNPQNNRSERSAQLAAALLYGVFGLLMFGPVAFGAVEPWSIFILEGGAAVLMLVWVAKQYLDGQMRIQWNPLFLPMAAFGFLIFVQLVFRRTAYPHDTTSSALLYCAYAMLCFLSTQTLLRSAQARKLAAILIVYGAVLAGFALLQGIAPNGKLYWIRTPRLGGWIYGPYVNHNHYAGLMEMLIPIPLVLTLTQMAQSKERMGAAIAAAIMATTLLLSGSRGGMLALFVELAILAVAFFRQQRRVRVAIGAAAFVVVLVSLSVWLGHSEISTRVTSIATEARSEVSGGTRFAINRDGLRMFRSKPVLGWGLGTFPVVYPQFRSFYTNFFVNQAHDDYLQLLVEMGLVGFGIMIWFLIVLYRRALSKLANWTADVSGATTLACVLGFTGILVHSLVDFNLEIPANAAFFYVLCTVAAADPFAQPKRRRKPVTTPAEEVFPASEVV